MSAPLLWRCYHDDDAPAFRKALGGAGSGGGINDRNHGRSSNNRSASGGGPVASPSQERQSVAGTSIPHKMGMKSRKTSAQQTGSPLTRADINSRDHAGLTLLHRAVSSTSPNAHDIATALIEHPLIDLYAQDAENGWTPLHRALYFGNVRLGHAIIERDARDATGEERSTTAARIGTSVMRVRDAEGNTPFDVYNSTIARRSEEIQTLQQESETDSDDEPDGKLSTNSVDEPRLGVAGDEVFAFGSNKNFSLGFADQDDRQFPERVALKRPDHLLFRFYHEHVASERDGPSYSLPNTPSTISDLPALILSRPIVIQDVRLAKLHSAILTTDPESNLYMCGFGPGGRLGTGDETTRFTYVPIDQSGLAGKRVVSIALGQNHSLAVTSGGEIFTWGTNTWGQLGYSLPRPSKQDQEPICPLPRQIFGPLKRETILGVAASSIHSVAFTSTSLYIWGKNEGQLGLMDSDSRSLEVQLGPRKIAASLFKAAVISVTAIDGATTVLLANHTVCVFTNYGYNVVKFPLDAGFSSSLNSDLLTRYDRDIAHITAVESGGNTIAALSSRGDLYVMAVRKPDLDTFNSTTNPSKIKNALTPPQRIWALRKGNWDGVKSVGVAEDGSVIVCTQAGAVWRGTKRIRAKDAFAGSSDKLRKDFKFQRVAGLTKVAAVRSNAYGVYVAIRKDCDVTKTQIHVENTTLWSDIGALLGLQGLEATKSTSVAKDDAPRFWVPAISKEHFDPLKRAILSSADIEVDIARHVETITGSDYDAEVTTDSCPGGIPVHRCILAARSTELRTLFGAPSDSPPIPGAVSLRSGSNGRPQIHFHGIDTYTLVNLVVFCYTDTVIDLWHFVRHRPPMAFRFRQVRVELMKLATALKLSTLEAAARLMVEPRPALHLDMALAIQDPRFLHDGDAVVELDGTTMAVHSVILCQRCPFFKGLFKGRAGGQWLSGRRQHSDEVVRIDLNHISPRTFELVLRFIYADVDVTLFDDVVSKDVDDFSDLVLDVLATADELMLDRLSQICQRLLGRFVTARNVCHIVNAVNACSVTTFKDAAFEYICLQLEAMLENHFLNDLDESLFDDLDRVVRANQLNSLPFVKSGRSEALLHERHPSLAGDIDEERRIRVKEMVFRAVQREGDSKPSTSYRTRMGSLEEAPATSPRHDAPRRAYRDTLNLASSPKLRPATSKPDLMFEMDEDSALPMDATSSIDQVNVQSPGPVTPVKSPAMGARVSAHAPEERALVYRTGSASLEITARSGTSPLMWSSPSSSTPKLNMREIMVAQTTSTVQLGTTPIKELSERRTSEGGNKTMKMSQKERKRQQQAKTQDSPAKQASPTVATPDAKQTSPWQIAGHKQVTALKDILDNPDRESTSPTTAKRSPGIRTASPDTRFSGQRRPPSNATVSSTSPRAPKQAVTTSSSPAIPQSRQYLSPPTAEPTLQLSMRDIIGQQEREIEVRKEAVAKRSLMEIQEEQAFQEWWDEESKKVREAEQHATETSERAREKGRGRGVEGRSRPPRSAKQSTTAPGSASSSRKTASTTAMTDGTPRDAVERGPGQSKTGRSRNRGRGRGGKEEQADVAGTPGASSKRSDPGVASRALEKALGRG